MARDSSATKARLLDAAFAEFAAYGIAGARVDRIAEAAGANKRLIYVYFGNKDQLFDAVMERALALGVEAVPFEAENLPGYAGRIFDHLVAHPDLMRLITWKHLERPGATDAEAQSYRAKTQAVAVAQRDGRIDPEYDPADVLILTLALAQAWFTIAGGMSPTGTGTPWPPQQLARHRAAVVDAVRRITAPRGDSAVGRSASSQA
ncbi:TetR family transcriptional regulator [Streptomyces sp. NPDC002889]|uniref:TetR family transcriptional regulator n=1 Tax=Streptomyces sp. NPDC002889 TaxID=3364669 RepID=UPI0036994B1E